MWAFLDWHRISKSDYEIDCLKEANRQAAVGHQAVEHLFFEGECSEFDLLMSFLKATRMRESELAYNPIIGLGKKAAFLHYAEKRREGYDDTLLIDAGVSFCGYHSDITRSYARENTPSVFRALIQGVDRIQQTLGMSVKPGISYQELHLKAVRELTGLLLNSGILEGSEEELLENQIPQNFFPHGLGHGLGLLVHDVAGKVKNLQGEKHDPLEGHPYLRLLRDIQLNEVVTIEPGLYFIEDLLNTLRASNNAKFVNWPLVDELIPCGGIRIEDDIVARSEGAQNLTRPFFNHK
jgi:Xaa-Pro dipeptidase